MRKVLHARNWGGSVNAPVCGTKSSAPEFSDTPTCRRCLALLERSSREKVMRGFDAGARAAFGRFVSQIPFEPLEETPSRRAPFATVTGPRINPRNRHTSSKPHVFTSFAGSRVAVDYTNPRPASILSRRQQLDIVSKRLNAQPSRESRARVSGE